MTTRPRAHGDRAGIVIAGGGLACQRACETLRRSGYDATIRVIAAESYPPYDRPPLSKEYLASERGESALRFRPPDWYADSCCWASAPRDSIRRRTKSQPRMALGSPMSSF